MKLLAAFFTAILIAGFGSCNGVRAQTQTTDNLVYTTVNPAPTGATYSWSGFSNTSSNGGGTSGGNVPGYNTTTGTFMFGYNQGTLAYTMAVNSALSGSGVQIGGINYGFQYINQDYTRGTLSTIVSLKSNTGATLNSYSHSLGSTTGGWTQFAQTQTFTNPYNLANVGNATMSITGKDDRWWAGYYGPQVKDPYITLNYTSDPCVGNPRYSSSCAGYNNSDMWYTGDLTSVYGTSFAIQTALGFGNTGVRVHSVDWGYDYTIGGRYCSGWNFIGICFGWSDSSVTGNLNISKSNGTTLLTDSQTTSGENISGSFRREVLLGTTSPDISTLGNASLSMSTTGIASYTPYIGFRFTPDICSTNPLINSQCPGYQQAYFSQQCSISALYDPQCPGYAAAVFTQQCNASQLFDPQCPGYAAAYLDYQCTSNSLYSTSCPGYQQAYLNQQCSNNPLYSTSCTGYATASTQCSANPLSHSYCPLYTTAVNDCSSNGLLHSYCPSYTLEQQLCVTDPLSNSLCSGYTTAINQCSNNQLLHPYCPGYKTTLAACSTNPQSNGLCPGYSSTATSSTTSTSTAEVTPTVSSSGEVSTTVSKTGDANVDKAITTTTTTTNTAAAPAAPVQLVQTQSTTSPTAPTQTAQKETKNDTKEPSGPSTDKQASAGSSPSTSSGDKKEVSGPTIREQIAAKRAEAGKTAEVKAGAAAQEEMGNAPTFAAQVAVQNVVVAAMGFNPGFDVYKMMIVSDAAGYKPFDIYKNQKSVDNARVLRRMSGASDKLHAEMLEQQYEGR